MVFSTLSNQQQATFEDIRRWFESPLGQHILKTEAAMLDQLLPGLFGYHLAQLSIQNEALYGSSRIGNRLCINLDSQTNGGIVGNPAQLPFADDSIDVVLLHHLLDFSASPVDVLREVSRVTLSMGHVVIVGFNPLSLWGLWQQVARFKGKAPWSGDYIRPGRLMDWLNLLNFKIDRAQYALYRPPMARYLGEVSDYSQGVSRNVNLPVGSVYVIVARKHVSAIRPIRPVWKARRAFGRLSAVPTKHKGLTSAKPYSGDKF